MSGKSKSWTYNKIRKAKWIVLGDGELLSVLVKTSEELGLRVYSYHAGGEIDNHDIYFLGYQENPYSFVEKSDWFILTSSWEGFPMVIGEAMACGTPVISSDCETGPREFLTKDIDSLTHNRNCQEAEYGILIPVIDSSYEKNDIESLVGQLDKLVSNKNLHDRYKEIGLERIHQFSSEKIMESWEHTIEGK